MRARIYHEQVMEKRLEQILRELVTLRELALVALRFPDMTEDERRYVLQRVKDIKV